MAEALPTPRSVPEPAPAPRPRPVRRRWLRWLGLVLLFLVVALVGGALWLRSQLRASLPQMDGERTVAGLAAPVTVERDGLGVPTIRAANRVDAARALGFLHAQERFFQMDLMRRQAAGELAELFGSVAVPVDEDHRRHGLRDVARRALAAGSPRDRAILNAYAEGANAGLGALGGPPFEYLLVQQDPAPWRPEDSLLVALAMFIELQQPEGTRELSLGVMHDLLPGPLFEFLSQSGSEWDAPLVGDPMTTPPIPGPEVFDVRREPAPSKPLKWRTIGEPRSSQTPRGSNNWAVAGTYTADGRAWLANDMHLGIRIPNTWYRASILVGDRRITGVTLPGVPVVAVGSTGRVAWGFTNSQIDWHDLVVIEVDPKDPEVYRTPQGPRRFVHRKETIRVKKGEDVTLDVRDTVWGPVVEDRDHKGRPLVLSWIAHHPDAVNMSILDLEEARTVDEAVEIAHRSGVPPQNFVVADADGRIAWTIIGRVPKRFGFDGIGGVIPESWADGTRGWSGWLASDEVPKVVDPPSGRIWTANSRIVEGPELARLGDSGYWLGARARQIRDGLLALHKAKPEDLLAIQLDDRALFLTPWRKILLDTLSPQAIEGHPRRREMRELLETSWTGRASVDSVGYRLVKEFRREVRNRTLEPILARCAQADERFWKLVTEKPAHLLDPKTKTWDEHLLAAADAVLAKYEGQDLAKRTWGERNTTRIRHPLSAALPGFLGRHLDVEPRQLPGDSDMPRFIGPAFGASERIVVSPGKEEAGFFHMPAGQSGHPLSAHYRDGQRAWEDGEPTSFLPGRTESTLKLVPGAGR
jgi:penicillin amidase